jgi:chromosome segregation ATPase
MKKTLARSSFAALVALALTPVLSHAGEAPSAARAEATKEKIQALRVECAGVRRQISTTMEELQRLNTKGVDLRPQFEKFKAELVKMEEQAKIARDRADDMRKKGDSAYADWEKEVQAINDPDLRKEAQKRQAKRQKYYSAILKSLTEAKEELVPFMSHLNDIRKLLDSQLTEDTVASTKGTIRKAGWSAEDVNDSLADVEQEIDRATAELNKYK